MENTIASITQHVKDVYDVLDEKGADIPENKNVENLAETILSISASATPTLSSLKKALDKGNAPEKYPIGTEIEDTYDGNSNPLIVAQYLDGSNNSNYGGVVGVILIRKYVEPISQQFGTNIYYDQSTVKNFLDTTYYNNCSEEIKSVISDINVTCRTSGSSSTSIESKWFLMGCCEVGGTYYPEEGIFWDYWKQKTGLSTASNTANSGRIVNGMNGNAVGWWLRSYGSNSPYVCLVSNNGTMTSGYAQYNASNGVLPACFIAKD